MISLLVVTQEGIGIEAATIGREGAVGLQRGLGFKNPKWITAIFVTNRFPGGFWEDRGYSWFAGV
jgi:hypothetical protein